MDSQERLRRRLELGEAWARLSYEGEFLGLSAQLGVVRPTLQSACSLEPKLDLRIADWPAMSFSIDLRW